MVNQQFIGTQRRYIISLDNFGSAVVHNQGRQTRAGPEKEEIVINSDLILIKNDGRVTKNRETENGSRKRDRGFGVWGLGFGEIGSADV